MEQPALTAVSSSVPLRPVRGFRGCVRRCVETLRRVPREELSVAGRWIEDHAPLLMQEAFAFLSPAPRLPGARGVPRVLHLARAVVKAGEGEVTAQGILRVFRCQLGDVELTQEELGALQTALRRALLEALTEEMDSACREAEEALRAGRVAAAWCAGNLERLPDGAGALVRFMDQLDWREDADALKRADEQLAREGRSLWQARQDAEREAEERGMMTGRLIQSLRGLGHLPWDALEERLNPVACLLRQEDTYRRMDSAGRGYYRSRVNQIARYLRVKETAVARAALALRGDQSGAAGQAGFYLLERPDRIAEYLMKHPGRLRPMRQGLFVLPLYGGAALALGLGIAAGAPWYTIPTLLLCGSELLRQGYFAFLRRRFPARLLPRISIKRLPESLRTLVVVPALLTSRRQALRMVRQLSVLRAANPDPGLDYLLLADFADAEASSLAGDEEILLAAQGGVSALNEQQGGGYYYLHRARTWDGGQRRYTGRERKRGALEMLNRLLSEGESRDPLACASFDPALLRGRYAYVITLDADTFLPPGAALDLIGAMEHPLQKGRVGVIQPRMETAADRAVTRVQRLLGGRGGVDPYCLAVQDVYQDVFGRGSFVGKGIYEPRAWLSALSGRLPRGRLLSHDLIEGEIAGSALASDIVLYDGHPARLAGWQKRLHRWTRGDWQLLPFLADFRLSLLSRHKIWDNLRRSLMPAARLTLLLSGAGTHLPALFLLGLPWPLRGQGARLMILPGQAYTLLDAIFRALYRQFFSHRGLLSWVTAEQAEERERPGLASILFQAGAGAGMILLSLLPGGWWPGALLGMAWAGGVLMTDWADRPERLSPPLTPRMEKSVRSLARDTWRFFADSVGPETMDLPPDNVQIDPEKGPAMRTSPTNIGLYLLSCCAARELGILTGADLARRFSSALASLESLPRWKGHFYNWYDLRDGAALAPAFVSTVDSGNLAACLLCCAQLLRNHLAELPRDARTLPARADALARGMDFSALYDEKAHLFFVGRFAQENRPTAAHYDLLASEARLASFVAVAMGQVERRHWRFLGRPVVRAGNGNALLSWGGTMFEYLMPHLLLPLTPGTLLGEGCLSAVRAQMSADPARPFGISESGYYAFDQDLNYQYRAFGLPALSMGGETGGSVVAPYASMLALPFFPRAAGENLLRMERLGWRDGWGLFEAVDYTPRRLESGPRIVKSHMAHHQGMILCSICNALLDGALWRAFMALPETRAYGCLLLEKPARHARRRVSPPAPREDGAEDAPLRRAAHPGLPVDAHLLSGGGLRWLLNESGQGCLRRGNLLLSRFDPEAGAQTGPQFYLRDSRSGAVLRPAAEGNAVFEDGAVRYTMTYEALRITLLCCVDPLLGMAAAALQAENLGPEGRDVECVSYLEIAQSEPAADAAHPNYRDLSVRVLPWKDNGLLSQRLAREPGEETPWIAHAVLGDVASLRRQGDRGLFLGREGTYRLPEQLTRDAALCAYRTGDVIAPCLSLRAGIQVPGNGKASVYFLVLCRNTREELEQLSLAGDRVRGAFSLAAIRARMMRRSLRMDGRMLGLYQQMLGAALFTGQPHQAALPAAPSGALWRYGVSCALPVVLVNLLPGPDQTLIRHALRFHGWLRAQGEPVDLVLFCPEETEYLRPCRDTATRLVAASAQRELINTAGGVFIVSGNETEERAAESLARLSLRSGQTLSSQLSALRIALPQRKNTHLAPALPGPVPPLLDAQPFGGFLEEGGYCVLRPAPAPWHQMLCGPAFGTLVCETGILHSYAGNSRLDRLTRLCPDVHRGLPSEEIFLRDDQGAVYPLIRCPAIYEPGEASYRVNAGGVQAEVSVYAHAAMSLGVRMADLRSDEVKTVKLFWLVRFSIGERPENTRCRAEDAFVFAQNGDHAGVAWMALTEAKGQALSPAACFGTRGEEAPIAVLESVHGLGSVGLLARVITLRPRETARLTLALGYSPSEEQARADYGKLLEEGAASALRAVRAQWGKQLQGLQCYLGDGRMERMMNLWLPYQALSSRLLARMGPYQQGGAFGFRDQLQDLLILLHTDPGAARAHLMLCAAHQYLEGDVQHWWHPPRRGVRTRISDDRLFLPYLTALYVRITGDEEILGEMAPYLLSAPLTEGERDRYEEPDIAPAQETLLQHCLRAVDSITLGQHDLPLMGGGDWNDGMNRVGGTHGESVWLGFFLALVLWEFAPLCPSEVRDRYNALRRRVLSGAENAWTGQWYLRAWYDDGRPLGGPDTHPPRIDLICQAFSALAGAPRHHVRVAIRRAVELLYDREKGMVRLLDPPFSPEEGAGYIGGYVPGVRENGGQYTHAVPWLILALCRIGEKALAWEIARAILPAAHSDTEEKARVYRLEPYVLAGDVYAGENRGRGGWSWYTGSAAWLYFAVLTGLMGFEKRGGRARLVPCAEPGMEEYTLVYRFGSASYHFTAARDSLFPTLDGVRLEDGWAELSDDGRIHEARFPLRDSP